MLSGHDLRRFLGLWKYALSIRREALSVLDVAVVAAECFPARRRCAIEGALLDELHVSTFLAPLLDADLRPSHTFTSVRQTPVLQAPVLARHLCLRSFGPFFTTLRRRKVVR